MGHSCAYQTLLNLPVGGGGFGGGELFEAAAVFVDQSAGIDDVAAGRVLTVEQSRARVTETLSRRRQSVGRSSSRSKRVVTSTQCRLVGQPTLYPAIAGLAGDRLPAFVGSCPYAGAPPSAVRFYDCEASNLNNRPNRPQKQNVPSLRQVTVAFNHCRPVPEGATSFHPQQCLL